MAGGAISRRYLLFMGAVGLLGLFIPDFRAIFGQLFFGPRGEEVPVWPIPTNPFSADGVSLVSVVRGSDVDSMVRGAVDLIGGMEKLNVKGKEVLVKPNVVSASPPPTTTSPELVASVVRLLYEAGAARVKVGDMSAIITLPTRKNIERTGIKAAAERAGAQVIDYDRGPWVKVTPAGAQYAESFYVAQPIYEAEVIVNLPVIKTHRSASYSISLKNFIGVIHPKNRPSLYRRDDWEEVIADINLSVHPVLTIADGLKTMVSGGPWRGLSASTGLIMASGDRVALDVAGLALIKAFGKWEMVTSKGVWEQRQVVRAVQLGLGAQGPERVKLLSQSLKGDDPEFADIVHRMKHFMGIPPV